MFLDLAVLMQAQGSQYDDFESNMQRGRSFYQMGEGEMERGREGEFFSIIYLFIQFKNILLILLKKEM